MRAFLCLTTAALALTLSGCGSPSPHDEDRSTTGTQSATAPAADASRAPDIAPTAAPGVAFSYRHSFALEPDRIAEVQEQHARACEALGVSRCRITGMHYRRRNEHDIDAMLRFKLEPSLARRFGQAALQSVAQAGGILVESQISGTDVGSGIAADTRTIQQLNEDLQRIERQLADPAVPAGQKQELRYQADALRQQIRAREQSREAQQETLATTPVTFEYGTEDYGSDRPSFSRILRQAGDGFVWGLYGLTVVLVTLAPWLALGLLLWLAARTVRRRLRRSAPAEPVETAAPPPAA